MSMARRPQVDTFELATRRGNYDEYPVLPFDKDPQLCLSRNRREQPFFLICQYDCVLAQLSGQGRITFQDASVRYFEMEPGDLVYVPGGVPHRYSPRTESIQYRYKAQPTGLEGVAWYCPECGRQLHREVWDTSIELPQEAYLRTTAFFSNTEALRRCSACNALHHPLDISNYQWTEVAAELRREL